MEVGFAPQGILLWMIEKPKCVLAGGASSAHIGLDYPWEYQRLLGLLNEA